MQHIEVGPVDTPWGVSYYYRVDGSLSAEGYANSASALHAAFKPQRADEHGRITPGQPPYRDL